MTLSASQRLESRSAQANGPPPTSGRIAARAPRSPARGPDAERRSVRRPCDHLGADNLLVRQELDRAVLHLRTFRQPVPVVMSTKAVMLHWLRDGFPEVRSSL